MSSVAAGSVQRAVLGELNIDRASSAVAQPLCCKSPQSGTVAVGVGVSPRASVQDKENVPPIYDSSLHQPVLHDDSDSDEEDPLAALDRMRRQRESAIAADDTWDELATGNQRRDEDDDEDDPFAAPSKLTLQRQRILAALARLSAEDDEEEKVPTPAANYSNSFSPSPPPAMTASSFAPQSMPFQPPPAAPSLPTTLASFPYGPRKPSTQQPPAARPDSFSVPNSNTSLTPHPDASAAITPPLSMQIESVCADVDLGGPRPSTSTTSKKRAADKRSTKDIAGCFGAAETNKARKVAEDTSPRKVVELFTTNEDEDEDEPSHPAAAAAIDIEQQLMEGGEDDGLDDEKPENQEGQVDEATGVSAGQAETAVEAGGGQDGNKGEEVDGDGDEEGEGAEVDVEEDEEQLAAELLAEDEEEDDEEHRLAARNQLGALNDNSDIAARHTTFEEEAEEDSDASHPSDEEDEAEEDWVALQAEEDKARRARLDQLHSQTQQVIRAAAQPFEFPHSLLDNRGEAVNARYAKLLEKVREREKTVGGVVKYIGETEEEEGRRRKRDEKERRERKRLAEGEAQPAVVEKEVDGELVLEIDVDELENEDMDDDDDDVEDGEDGAESVDEQPMKEQSSDEIGAGAVDAEASISQLSTTPAAKPSPDNEVHNTTALPSARPLKEVVAEQARQSAAPLSPVAVPSDEATQSESDKQAVEQVGERVTEADEDLIDDDMDEDMKAMIRKAQATRKRKREQQAALAAQPPQQQQPQPQPQHAAEPVPATLATATPTLSPEVGSPSADLAPITLSRTIALPSAFSELMERGTAAQQQQQCDGEEGESRKRRKSESMVEDEAEDDDLAEGRRQRDVEDDEAESDNSKNEYEQDGFMVCDADVEQADADVTRQVHADVDREKDEREVAAIASRFASNSLTASRSPSDHASGAVTKTASNSLTRKGSNASSTSSSPSKRSPSPSSLPTPPLRSVSIVTGSLLDEDRVDSSEEEEEVDENSTARKNKRATLQFRTRMLRKPASLLTAPPSASSPQSSPIKSLSGFELLEEMSLSSAAVMAAPSTPLAAPARRGSVVKDKANDFSALHAEITRQRSLIRHNSFLVERTSSLVSSSVATATTAAAGGGVVSVKSVSLSKSYIFRRVTDENNENTAHKRSTSPSTNQPSVSADKASKVNKHGKGREQQEVAKCAVAGSVVLAQLQRSKTLSPALLAARMGRRPSGSMLAAFAKPNTIRAVSDR